MSFLGNDFCIIDDPDNRIIPGVSNIISNPTTNALAPISRVFPDLRLYFERNDLDQGYNWDGPVSITIRERGERNLIASCMNVDWLQF